MASADEKAKFRVQAFPNSRMVNRMFVSIALLCVIFLYLETDRCLKEQYMMERPVLNEISMKNLEHNRPSGTITQSGSK